MDHDKYFMEYIPGLHVNAPVNSVTGRRRRQQMQSLGHFPRTKAERDALTVSVRYGFCLVVHRRRRRLISLG